MPVVSARWGGASWRQFGYLHHKEAVPGVDAQLFKAASFLDDQDKHTLDTLHL